MKYALDSYLADSVIIIKVFENGLLCGLLTGFVSWMTHEVKVYPRKVLLAHWRYDGPRVIKVEDISGL